MFCSSPVLIPVAIAAPVTLPPCIHLGISDGGDAVAAAEDIIMTRAITERTNEWFQLAIFVSVIGIQSILYLNCEYRTIFQVDCEDFMSSKGF